MSDTSRIGLRGRGSLANDLARRVTELETIVAKVTHCGTCGDTWYDSAIGSASCPHCRIAELDALVKGYYNEAADGWEKYRAAERRIAELEPDAERWRYIRARGGSPWAETDIAWGHPDMMDNDIDAAMRKEEK